MATQQGERRGGGGGAVGAAKAEASHLNLGPLRFIIEEVRELMLSGVFHAWRPRGLGLERGRTAEGLCGHEELLPMGCRCERDKMRHRALQFNHGTQVCCSLQAGSLSLNTASFAKATTQAPQQQPQQQQPTNMIKAAMGTAATNGTSCRHTAFR